MSHDAILAKGHSVKSEGNVLYTVKGGSGLFLKYLRRGSSYYIDVGTSQLLIDGKVQLARESAICGSPPRCRSCGFTAAICASRVTTPSIWLCS